MSGVVEQAVFVETLRLVASDDPAAITRRAIAVGAGVSRQTLYNRWASTGEIVLDALLDRAAATVGRAADGDLRAYLTDLADAVETWARPGLRAVATFAQLDPDLAARFRGQFLTERHGALTAAVRDELGARAEEAVADVTELIAASLWYRVLVVDEPLDQSWIERMSSLASR